MADGPITLGVSSWGEMLRLHRDLVPLILISILRDLENSTAIVSLSPLEFWINLMLMERKATSHGVRLYLAELNRLLDLNPNGNYYRTQLISSFSSVRDLHRFIGDHIAVLNEGEPDSPEGWAV